MNANVSISCLSYLEKWTINNKYTKYIYIYIYIYIYKYKYNTMKFTNKVLNTINKQ